MKTKLLFTFLLICALGYSQTYNNTTYFISEVVGSPPNSTNDFLNDSDDPTLPMYQSDVDDGIEYFEFFGTPNAVIDNDVYFIVIDGDGDDSDVGNGNIGKVREAIDLSGLQFGSNGILAIVADITMDPGAVDLLGNDMSGTKFINPYATDLAASDANVVTIQLTASTIDWSDENPSDGTNETLNKFNISSRTPDIGYDGSLNDQSATYMIVKSTAGNPKDALVDTGGAVDPDPTVADGVLDGVATAWIIYDSVSVLDDDDDAPGNGEIGEFGYGKVIFYEHLNSNPAVLTYDASISPTLVPLNQYPNYVARQGTLTGYACSSDGIDDNDDWLAGRVNSLSYPDWKFSSTGTRNVPSLPLTGNNLSGLGADSDINGLSFGEVNVSFSTLSIDEVLPSKFKVHPNPASDYLTIESNALDIASIAMYDILGKKVLSQKELTNNRLDVSNLNKGVYFLKINADGNSITKKIIIQ